MSVECAHKLVFVADGQPSNENEESATATESVLGKFSHRPQSKRTATNENNF